MLEQAVEAFVQEATEIMGSLEDRMLALEDGATQCQVDEIFRSLHTIKGSGAMFGYTCLSRFTHSFENAFEMVRAGALAVDRPLIDLCLAACDVMVEFLGFSGDTDQAQALLVDPRVVDLTDRLASLTGQPAPGGEAPSKRAGAGHTGSTDELRSFQIRFTPDETALINGMRPDLLIAELGELGEIAVSYDASAMPPLSELDPTRAYLCYVITLVTRAAREAIEDVFIFADDAALQIDEVAAPIATDVKQEAPSSASPAGAPAQAAGAEPATTARGDARSDSIRVASSRLDDMMDSLGELVIAQARLDAVVQEIDDPTLESVAEEVARLIVGLRDATLSIRMLPVETVFGKFKRVVRDLSSELGKNVQLVTEGGETEVDKNVIDRIGEPIVHMIRNAIDHGLETAEARVAVGKKPTGIVKLAARQEGGEILISIEDNGRGLDVDVIRAIAIKRGVVSEDDALTEAEIQKLIFEPGFSTAESITSVSGRGVGMDAVKSVLDALGGAIDVFSRKGRGTRVTLRLPVTMAIIDGLRVRLGDSVYVIPLVSVEECVELSAADASRRSGRSVLEIRNEMVPFLELQDLFNQPGDGAQRRRVVIVRVDGARIGLVVDDILGQGQTVIKSLSSFHSAIPGLGGATILGDGRVALIIDVATLVRDAEGAQSSAVRDAA